MHEISGLHSCVSYIFEEAKVRTCIRVISVLQRQCQFSLILSTLE
jgi:hypothetical protein